jgi:hypothetical protein
MARAARNRLEDLTEETGTPASMVDRVGSFYAERVEWLERRGQLVRQAGPPVPALTALATSQLRARRGALPRGREARPADTGPWGTSKQQCWRLYWSQHLTTG